MMSTNFILVRHGEPRYDEIMVDETHGLAWDFGRLTDEGIKQVKTLANDARFYNADLIISSPYTRALETAAVIASITGIDIRVENDLHEWSPDLTFNHQFGPEKALEMKEIMNEYFAFQGHPPRDSKFHWEAITAVKNRVLNVLYKYLKYRTVIVVCHGIVMDSLTEFDHRYGYCDTAEITL